ncbi:MAG: sugar-binding domain-containing protein [Candidatus Latescibacterota bacterium]
MRQISLDGTWHLTWFPEGKYAVSGPADLKTLHAPSVPAQVPGNVELDLMRAGHLPDVFYGDNIHRLRELEGCEWWYSTTFATPLQTAGKRLRLVFHGLDCLATVWLNGEVLGAAANMLVEHAFDVTAKLRASGANQLVVRLGSAVNAARAYEYPPSCHTGMVNYEHLYVRKAPHTYGWDIAPRAVSAGIWRSVVLEVHEPTAIEDIYYATQEVRGGVAGLRLHWRIRTERPVPEGLRLRFRGACGESRFEVEVPVRFVAGQEQVAVPGARLWWPRGYGAADLYTVTCELVADGTVVDQRTDLIGLRQVELLRTDTTTPSQPGEFLFRCNGLPILCKGSNWVPADAFHSRDAERYAPILALFADLQCNILRCWGGNVYEDHAFYSLCDRLGIMVWQDFAFACALYPQDEEFLGRVRQEAEAVVRKLRNHPSIVLWAGDNENDVIYLALGLDPAANRLTRHVLPQVCQAQDPWRPYLPSSPYVAPEVARRRAPELMPEQHLWGPRDYYKSRFYTEMTAHFASEIGYHGCPSVSSLRRFLDAGHLWPWQDNAHWRAHATDAVPEGGPCQYRVKLMADQIGELFGQQPLTLEEFVLASQISQAEAKKFFIEMFRLRKWRTTGIIWWNVIDCWPQFSDAVVDYYFQRKLAYWYIRRVQQPLCLMVTEPEDWHSRVVVGNDSREAATGTFRVRDAERGAVLLQGGFAVEANANREVGRIRVSRGEQRLLLLEWEWAGGQGGNHYLLGTPPLSLDQYRAWLPQIAALPLGFDAQAVGC